MREHACLGMDAAGIHVVLDIHGVPVQHALREAGNDPRNEPCHGGDQQQAIDMPHIVDPAQFVRGGLPDSLQREQQQNRLRRDPHLDDHGMEYLGGTRDPQ
jgi:hypothetical protein